MSKNTADRVIGRSKRAEMSDIHDIRTLTATGPIDLPHRPSDPKAESPETSELN